MTTATLTSEPTTTYAGTLAAASPNHVRCLYFCLHVNADDSAALSLLDGLDRTPLSEILLPAEVARPIVATFEGD